MVELYNLLSTLGVVVLIISSLIFLYNLITSIRNGEASGNDPWDARTLEWMTESPTPEVNFYEIPTVTHRDEFWHRKYAEDEAGVPVPVPAGASEDHEDGTEAAGAQADAGTATADVHDEHDDEHHIHMPDPSYWPFVMCIGFLPFGYGAVILVGVLWMFIGFYGWIIEPVAEGDDD